MTRNDIGVRIRCKADELYSAPEKEKIMAKSELGSMTDAKKRAEMSVLASFYGNLLTERQREIVTATCNYDVSLGEIAESLGISRQAVRDSLVRGETLLRESEERLGFVALLNKIGELTKVESGREREALSEIAALIGVE